MYFAIIPPLLRYSIVKLDMSFNGKLSDGLLDREILTALFEAKMPIEAWRKKYDLIWPHSSLGYRLSAPEAIQPFYMPIALTLEAVQ